MAGRIQMLFQCSRPAFKGRFGQQVSLQQATSTIQLYMLHLAGCSLQIAEMHTNEVAVPDLYDYSGSQEMQTCRFAQRHQVML
jgi:hypothetical protein